MTPERIACLAALVEIYDERGEDWSYVGFAPIAKKTGLDTKAVRRHIRALARDGLAVFCSGLCDEDGNFRGSGYSATPAGAATVAFLAAGRVK
jgi:DNA-binding MarR family transcriptional regulator